VRNHVIITTRYAQRWAINVRVFNTNTPSPTTCQRTSQGKTDGKILQWPEG